MRGATFDGPFGVLAGEKTIDQTGSEGIAAADAIKDFDAFAIGGLEKLSIVVTDGAPIVARGGFGLAQSGGNYLERKFLNHFPNHLLETADFEGGEVLIHAGHFETESGGKIFFVAEHNVDVGSEQAIHFLGAGFAANGFPERVAVVQVVRNDGAVFARGLHGFGSDFRSGGRKSAEDTAGVKPARAEFAEDIFPIDVAGFQLRDRSVAAIGAAKSGADAEASLSKVEAVADGAADAIVRDPADQGLIDAALIDEVLRETADGIIGEHGDDGSIETKTAFEAASDIIFAATFINIKAARGPDPFFAGVEAEHDFAETDEVPGATGFGFDLELHVRT